MWVRSAHGNRHSSVKIYQTQSEIHVTTHIQVNLAIFQAVIMKLVLLLLVVVLPGIICPPVDKKIVKPPSPPEEDPDVKPVEEDVVRNVYL